MLQKTIIFFLSLFFVTSLWSQNVYYFGKPVFNGNFYQEEFGSLKKEDPCQWVKIGDLLIEKDTVYPISVWSYTKIISHNSGKYIISAPDRLAFLDLNTLETKVFKELTFERDYEYIHDVVCDSSGLLHLFGNSYYTYDIETKEYKFIDTIDAPYLPEPVFRVDFHFQGDWVGNKYIFIEYRVGDYKIKELNFEDHGLSKHILTLPDSMESIDFFYTLREGCNRYKSFFHEYRLIFDSISRDNIGVQEYRYCIDWEDRSITRVCDFGIQPNRFFRGVDSDGTTCGPFDHCPFYLDLDTADASGFYGMNYRTDTFCTRKTRVIQNPLLQAQSGPVDSIQIFFYDGDFDNRLHGRGTEYVYPAHFDSLVNVQWRAALGSWKIINTGGASSADFERALRNIAYENSRAEDYTSGNRILAFVPWSGGFSTDTAFLHLPLAFLDYPPFLGADTFICSNGGLLINLPSNVASATWSDGEMALIRYLTTAGNYSVTAVDRSGCTLHDTLQIDLAPASMRYDTLVVCPGDSARIFGEWKTQSATYQKLFTNQYGCDSLQFYTLENYPPFDVSFETKASCKNQPTGAIKLLPDVGVAQIVWSDLPSGELERTALSPGTYSCTLTNFQGCKTQLNIEVSEFPQTDYLITPDTTIFEGQQIQLFFDFQNGSPASVSWQPGEGLSCTDCLRPLAMPETSTLYTVEATDENGCIFTAQTQISLRRDFSFYVPSAFTPNGDFNNDVLTVYGITGSQVVEFKIYDTWGELLFEKTDFPVNDEAAGWNGEFRGKALNQNVFVWKARVRYPDGSEETRRGDVLLIR